MKHYHPPILEPERRLRTEEELIVELMGRVRKRGDLSRLAVEVGLAQGTISNILTGGKPIGRAVAEKLGYRRVIRFEPIE